MSRPARHAATTGSVEAADVAALRGGDIARPREGSFFLFQLLLLWLWFEFVRPSVNLKVQLLSSVVLGLAWLGMPRKQFAPHSWWFLVLLMVLAAGFVGAANTYSAALSWRLMTTLFVGACLPLQALLTSVRRFRLWIYSFLLIAFYIGGWAATHRGFGPAGAAGGQDENYVAALAGMAIGIGYFAVFAERRAAVRMLIIVGMVACVGAIALGANPSRGGFLGLCVVGTYCLLRSPKRAKGLVVVGGLIAMLVLLAGPTFWKEIATSTDYKSGTGDMRLELWKAGLRMWIANPLFGVGGDNYRWVVENYQTAEQFAKFGRSLGGSVVAHSFFVEMLAEVGTVGAIATAWLIVGSWRGLGAVRDRILALPARLVTPDLHQLRCFADGLRCAILAVLANGVFLSLFYYAHLWVLLAAGTAVPFVYRRMYQVDGSASAIRSRGASPSRPAGGSSALAAAAGLTTR